MRNKFKQLLTLALFASTCQLASAHDFGVDGIYYNILSWEDRTVEVTNYDWNYDQTAELYIDDITIPQIVNYEGTDYTVMQIGGYAFYNCYSLTSITIPSTVVRIESSAFYKCTALSNLTIEDGNSELSIGFNDENWASLFSDCPLESIYLGRTTQCELELGPFAGISTLTSVEISDAVTSICNYAFKGCYNLTSVGDLSACTSIGERAFYGCSALTSVDLSACTSIGYNAFRGCSALTSVGDLSACISIGYAAFYGCSALTSVGDLSACTSIGYESFYGCNSLASVGDLSACTSIGGKAFYGCSALTSVDLSACTSIGEYAFSDCNSLAIITITGSEVPELGSSSSIGDITTVRVPSNLLADYKNAENWKDLSSRIIAIGSEPAVVQHVTMQDNTSGLHAAIGEEKLASVIELKVIGDINSYDIGIIRDKMPNLHYLDLSEARIRANDYCYYGGYCTSDDILGDYAFYDLHKLLKVVLPDKITSIGSQAFQNCYYLQDVNIPLSATTISDGAFNDCSALKNISIPADVTSIGSWAFINCYKLQTVHFAPKSKLTEIYDYAFCNCNQLKSLELPNSVSYIGDYAFYNCNSLTELYLPTSLNYVGDYAFDECPNLRKVYASAPDAYAVSIVDETFAAATREQGTLYVPFDEETGWRATYDTYYWQTQWKRFLNIAKWRPEYDHFPIDNDYDQEVGTIPGDEINAEFGPNAGYILGEEALQHFKTVEIKCNGSQGGSIIVKGDKNISIGELFVEIDVEGSKWYFFCFPFDIKLSDVTCGKDGRFVFRKYDGEARAEGGTGWTNLAADEEWLKAGVGYIFQCNKAGVLRMPILDPEFADTDKSPVLDAHPAADDQDASWNFVGNPYLAYYQLEDLGYEAPITYWDGYNYVAVRPGDDDYVFQPYQAFFVQKPTDSAAVGFDGANQQTYTQSQKAVAEARQRRAQKRVNPDRLIVNVTLSDGEHSDQTRVVYNNKTSVGYEMACDAAKFMSTESVPQLFTVNGTVQYAINERPQGEVELGFKAPKAGTYTIRMTRMDAPMLLKDLKTGVTFDFTIGEDYVFETEAGTITNRFVLLLNPNTNRIENMTIADAENAQFYNLAGQQTQGETDAIQIMKQGETAKKVMMR